MSNLKMKLPSEDASISDLVVFALSFKGYEYIGGGPAKLADLWDRVIPLLNEDKLDEVSIEDIRACLFFQQRADRWNQVDPNIEEYRFFVDKLKQKGYT